MTGEEIKHKRKQLGLSQEELATLIGVGKNTVYNYESGGTIPKGKIPILEKALNPNNGIKKEEGKEDPPEKGGIEIIIAKKVLDRLKPYLEDFQKGHKTTWQNQQELIELNKAMAVLLDELMDEVDDLKKDVAVLKKSCLETSKNVSDMHKVVARE